MKLRRAMVATAATAVIAPLALLSAPAAFATAADEGQTTSSSSPSAEGPTSSPEESASTSEAPTSTPEESASTSEGPASTPEESTPAAGDGESASPSGSPSSSASASPTPSPTDDGFDPFEDCESLKDDTKLTATISGLPNKIVAGSGWHNFKFVVKNDSDHDRKNVWVDAFAEYSDENVDDSLAFDMATIQVKQNGKWDNTYHEAFGDTTLTGTFSAVFGTLEAHTSAELDLRVSIKASAPAGSSFALSQAVYAGKNGTCYGNIDFYEFEVLAAGSKPGNVSDSKPTGKKPKGFNHNVKPQGGAKQVTGNLAETGSSSMLPTFALVGGLAVVAGGGVVFAVRRRKTDGMTV